jgi:hypothetical protein
MLGVSGVVPDGVGAAYLTAPDGTAVKADVVDNGYAFVVPRPRTPQVRYVVWVGGDGTPHVQPVPHLFAARGACREAVTRLTRLTPEPFACGPRVVLPATRPAPRRRVPRVLHAAPLCDPAVMPMPVPVPAVPPPAPGPGPSRP